MLVERRDGKCRNCDGQLAIIDADDVSMTVQCLECEEEYSVEGDAFGDGGMHYHLQFLIEKG